MFQLHEYDTPTKSSATPIMSVRASAPYRRNEEQQMALVKGSRDKGKLHIEGPRFSPHRPLDSYHSTRYYGLL